MIKRIVEELKRVHNKNGKPFFTNLNDLVVNVKEGYKLEFMLECVNYLDQKGIRILADVLSKIPDFEGNMKYNKVRDKIIITVILNDK